MIDIQATTKSKYYDHNSIIIFWIQKISLSVDNYVRQTKFGRHIVFAPFLLLIIIMAPKRSFVRHITFALFLIITSPRLLSGDVLLFYLLHHPDCCRMMYCYSIIISITSCCRVMYCYSIILLLIIIILYYRNQARNN
jgi:hypothetical protein